MNEILRRRFEIWRSTITGWWYVHDKRTPGELTHHQSKGLRRYYDTRDEAEGAVQAELERIGYGRQVQARQAVIR